ncbi:HNH endonuclease signature motif containing protein [Streptomyces coelicoflavus]|uniref:HNH endonuclease signature motif containing protein n=1 Tax=Streptomyces coelicoflavus TaxID=285562 RepID=UPI003676047D
MNSTIETSAVEAREAQVVATIELPDGEPYDVTVADLVRMLDKAELSEDGQHVVWTGAKTADGYGTVHMGGHTMYVHRITYQFVNGPIPEGLLLDHRCRIRHCCSAACLEPVTNAENILRGESPSAINARKTHCKNGHAFNLENTRSCTSSGRSRRVCLACEQSRNAARYLQAA